MEVNQAFAISQDAGRLAIERAFNAPGLAVLDAEIPVDSADLQGQRVDRGIGTSAEVDRVVRSGRIQFRTSGKSLIAQAGDEDLPQHDPITWFRDCGLLSN